MEKIGLKVPLAKLAHNIEECWEVQQLVGYPCIIRPNFTLGGSGGGIQNDTTKQNNIEDSSQVSNDMYDEIPY